MFGGSSLFFRLYVVSFMLCCYYHPSYSFAIWIEPIRVLKPSDWKGSKLSEPMRRCLFLFFIFAVSSLSVSKNFLAPLYVFLSISSLSWLKRDLVWLASARAVFEACLEELFVYKHQSAESAPHK